MSDIRAVLVWMSGVVTQSIPTALADISLLSGKTPANPAVLSLLWEPFVLGQMAEVEFCKLASQRIGLEVEPGQLRQELLARLAPRRAVLDEIQKLPEAYQRWLVVDLPTAWYELMDTRPLLYTLFSPQRLIFLGNMVDII